MIPWKRLATAKTPDGGELSLWQRGTELVVRVGSLDLMSTREHGSEEVLAQHGVGDLGEGATVLVGGLGFGFTLRATLGLLPRNAKVVVSELVPEVVDWVKGPVGAGDLLEDPRVEVEIGDVADILRGGSGRLFDAILLDVDNGPSAFTVGSNHRLYSGLGLEATARCLRPGGRLAVWSAGHDPAFMARLHKSGFDAKTFGVRARGKAGGAKQAIFLGIKR